MSLDRLALILFCIVAFGGAAIWLVSLILVTASLNPLLSIIPIAIAALGAYVVIRVFSERTQNPDEDHYDNMEN